MPRYVVLRHEIPVGSSLSGRSSHWDIMLEHQAALLTWAVEQAPDLPISIKALRLDDHRLDYLEYEGPVSQQRGYVSRWDQGTFRWIDHTANHVVVELDGTKLHGRLQLDHDTDDEVDTGDYWRLIFSPTDSATRG